MSDIFISYSSADRKRAKTIAEALEEKGWSVWWDRKIPPGKSYAQVIKEALDAAKCILVLWSKDSVKSDWVQNEAAEGVRRKILVPALIENVEIPFEFRRIQAANLIKWNPSTPNDEFNEFVAAIVNFVGRPKSEKIEHKFQLQKDVLTDYNEKNITTKSGYSDNKDYFDIAFELYEKGKYKEAVENFTKAIELDPSDKVVYNNRGLFYEKIGEYEKADEDFKIAKELGSEE